MIICFTDVKDELSDVYSICSNYDEIYIGDISLLLNDVNYNTYWNDIYGCRTGLFDIDGYEFYVCGVEGNDGYFVDTDGAEYDVSSGCIGIVPVELCSCDIGSIEKCRRLITKSVNIQVLSDKAIYVEYNTGNFTIPISFEDVLTVEEISGVQDDFDCSELLDDDEDFDCLDLIDGKEEFDCVSSY